MTDEAVFREFIQNTGETDYDKEEAWYRWEYGAAQLDAQRMSTRLKERYRADSGKVLTLAGEDEPKEPEAENQKQLMAPARTILVMIGKMKASKEE